MKIKAALPTIFQKAYPVLDPTTQMLPAVSLLRFHDIDALPLSFDAGKKPRAVFGFSSLARLMALGPEGFGPFLKQPCKDASEDLATVRADDDLRSLLQTFDRTRFGFARVEERRDVGALVSLSDLLGLFETGALRTDLLVSDVASPILSVPGQTTLKKSLQEMFTKRYRRLFISGNKEFVSDREIIAHIFSPSVLSMITRDSKDILTTPISQIERMAAKKVTPNATVKAAAMALRAEKGQCLVYDNCVITPWDIIMKPWKAKALKMK